MLQRTARRFSRRGSTVVLLLVVLVVLLGVIALSLDTGMVALRKTELQRATDAAVLAAASALLEGDASESQARAEGLAYLTHNAISTDHPDRQITVEFGTWDHKKRNFKRSAYAEANAARVQVLETGNRLFFGRALGAAAYDARAEAIAFTEGRIAPRDIMLVIDCSTSMDNDQADPQQPMTAVKQGAQWLCDVVSSQDRVGLTVYNWSNAEGHGTGRVELPLTATVAFVKTRINDLTAGFYTSGTNIAGGIRAGGQSLHATARSNVDRLLVVLTDGQANASEPPHGGDDDDDDADAAASARAWAHDIRALGIRIDTISLGDSADHALMQEVAEGGLADGHRLKGRHFAITGSIADYSASLRAAFQEIGSGKRRATLVD